MSQLTLDGASIPLKSREPKRDLTPAELRLWNFLRGVGPRTEKQIHSKFLDLSTVGNKLRSMRKKGYVDNIKQRDEPQLWRAK